MRSRRIAGWAAVVIALVGLASCGRSAETSGLNLPEYTPGSPTADPAPDPLVVALKALSDAESVTFKGARGDLVVDLAFRGEDGSGTVTLGGQEFRVIMAGGTAWYRGDVPFYEAIGLVPKEVADATDARWIQSGSPAIAAIDRFSTRSAFVTDFLAVGAGTASPPGLTVDAATGRPIRVTDSPDDTTGGIAVTYDEVTGPTAPSTDEILDPAAFS